MQNAVIKKLRLDQTNDLAKVKDWINQIYAQICVETEALQQSATMTLTANSSTYTLPSAVIRIRYMTITPVGGNVSPALRETTIDDLLLRRAANAGVAPATGASTHYALLGLNQFELWPTPSTADSLKMYYIYLPTALSLDTDIPVFQEPWPKAIEYGSLAEAADFVKDPNEQEYRALYEAWMQRFRAHLHKRRSGGADQFQIYPGMYIIRDPSRDIRSDDG